jgi:predicted nucleotidyltransferase
MTFDPAQILETLAKHGVDHIVVGGVGGVLHGAPMSTDDVDIVPALRKTNLESLADALNEMHARVQVTDEPDGIAMGFTGKDLRRWIVDFMFLNLMTDYGRLDILYRPEGTNGYQDLAANAEELDLGDLKVRVASLEDIIRSKQAVARDRDLEQLPTLRLLLESKKTGIRPGQEVIVPWESSEARGTVIEIRGVGPGAQASVRVQVPGDGEEVLPFPVRHLRSADA